jgi:hypothetical protein
LTGAVHPPGNWRRHRLLPLNEIDSRLAATDLGASNRAAVLQLATLLRDLRQPVLERLRRGGRRQRMHAMTLNQPSYSLSLGSQSGVVEHDGPLLKIQLKLFSGIGGAGLISLPGIPSLRVIRGHGRFSTADWRRRSEFQREFAAFNAAALTRSDGVGAMLRPGPIGALDELESGWVR